MTTDFWTRVLAEYDADSDTTTWSICSRSKTFYEAYNFTGGYKAMQTLAKQFLSDTNAGELFTLGITYLFLLRSEYYGDFEDNLRRRVAVRRDFLLWARDNDRNDGNDDNLTTP